MAIPKSVWAIDIGQCALKALKLRDVDGELQVDAFDIIPHPKILSQPDADRRQLIRNALDQFMARNSVVGSAVVIAVPGQASFTRFVKLPPVEAKRIPEIVKFEAGQQIPFPIDDVIWRYQTFNDPDTPDIEVGIFAMKKVDVQEMLSHYNEVKLGVDIVQMAPLALYNFMTFDGQLAGDGATLLTDVGADKTDLVVADGPRMWTRTIQIGGNNFTEALVRAFKLSFPKAEKLKRDAASSKYARQVFQAMRPVFADLVQEIQRSIGFYTSLHRETRFKKLIGLGNGFRLPGLQKFLEQNLGISVVRIDSYNKLTPSATVNAPVFTENVLSFAVAYGLALQGLGQTSINTNLLPSEVARRRLWESKRPWFAGAAAVVLACMAGMTYGSIRDRSAVGFGVAPSPDTNLGKTNAIVLEQQKNQAAARDVQNQGEQEIQQIGQYLHLYGYHKTWPAIQTLLSRVLKDSFREQHLLSEIALETNADARQALIKQLEATKEGPRERNTRQIVFVESLKSDYMPDLGAKASGGAAVGSGAGKSGFVVTAVLRTPLDYGNAAITKLMTAHESILKAGLKDVVAGLIEVVDVELSKPMRVEGGGEVGGRLDPLFPKEDTSGDTRFTVTWKIAVLGDGVIVPQDEPKARQ